MIIGAKINQHFSLLKSDTQYFVLFDFGIDNSNACAIGLEFIE